MNFRFFLQEPDKAKILTLGFVVGLLSSSLGIGGGVVIVPALMQFFGKNIKTAIGTSLAVIMPISLFAFGVHYFQYGAELHLPIVLFTFIGGIFGTKFGAIFASKIKTEFLEILFALLLFVVGLKLTGLLNITTVDSLSLDQSVSIYLPAVLLGLGTGLASAFFGIGGGVIIVPALNLFFGLSIHEAISTSLLVIFPMSTMALFFHKKLNNVDFAIARYMVPTALLGAIFGAFISHLLPGDILKIIFGIFVLMMNLKFIFHIWKRA